MDEVTVFDRHAGDYDRWFDGNGRIYQAEISALRRLVPRTGAGLEVGAGTGRFSIPLGIATGIEPSGNMARIAMERKLSVCRAVGECLPFRDDQFDFALLVTVVCFVKDAALLLRETGRVIKAGGKIIIAFIDKDSALGRLYESRKNTNRFYSEARFYSALEIDGLVKGAGFRELRFCQTLIGLPDDGESAYKVRDGRGEGGFVVLGATKPILRKPIKR